MWYLYICMYVYLGKINSFNMEKARLEMKANISINII